MKPKVSAGIMGVVMAASAAAMNPSAEAMPPKETDVIVNLGDSITDGFTYGQIIMQALKEAGKPVPAIICSGIGGNTAKQMAARADKTVFAYNPQIVTFSAGTNDALHGVPPKEYEAALLEIAAKAKAKGIQMILLTPCVILSENGKTAEEKKANAKKTDEMLDCYEWIIRKVAKENGFLVAENRALMAEAVKAGKKIMTEDGIHPDYYGQTLIARSILDAMDCRDVQLPNVFEPKLFPGVIREWKMRVAPVDVKGKPVTLNEETVLLVNPDETWKTHEIPEAAPNPPVSAEDWLEQCRRNGYTLKLQETVGKGQIQAVADLKSDGERQVYFQIAIGVMNLWLNGKKIHEQGDAWTGFHAGKERVPATLKPGNNRIVVEVSGNNFFLSVTDKMIWEEELKR